MNIFKKKQKNIGCTFEQLRKNINAHFAEQAKEPTQKEQQVKKVLRLANENYDCT